MVLGVRPAYGMSYSLNPKADINLPVCEVDFLMVIPGYGHRVKADVLLGECKDEGGAIDAADVEHLRQVADALPASRFVTYIVFAKLAPFAAEEIALIRTLNGPYQRRVILLTAQGTRALPYLRAFETGARQSSLCYLCRRPGGRYGAHLLSRAS